MNEIFTRAKYDVNSDWDLKIHIMSTRIANSVQNEILKHVVPPTKLIKYSTKYNIYLYCL